ncbi:hypothetical protein PUN28_006370 [Cardiocondyla obscurior]|uniref:Uncharacterized protein n=1 Tax=Cardiocondyla obscurior TaxID=286306 RepID=A0AAW2GDB8_9HYME
MTFLSEIDGLRTPCLITHARPSYFHSFISPYLLLHQPCDPYSFICFWTDSKTN